jgi:LysM repeat protein
MNRTLIHILAALCLTASLPTGVAAQDYVAPPVTVSKEKVRSGGNVYYSHVVLERQTLYSISKAYGVTIEEIYESNPTLRLETDGLKKNQILMIPVREIPQADKAGNAVEAGDAAAPQEPKTVVEKKAPVNGPDDFFIHKVKWFEDLETIAKKYNVSKEAILNINGMTSDKIKRRQELKIPYHPEIWEGRTTVQEPEKAEEVVGFNPTEEDQPDTTAKEKKGIDDIFDDLFVREGKHDVSISMLIPFSSPRAGDRVSFMDMYCGSLLAARSMGRDGTNLDIHTFDVSGGAMPVTYERFAQSDFAIGPVSRNDIKKAAAVADESTWIVSPLDMQVESLADTLRNLIQAPTPTSVQIKDMVKWIKADMRSGDKVIVVTPTNPASAYRDMVEKEMSAAGLPHSTTTLGSVSALMTSSGSNRIVLACDFTDKSTVFLIEAVRNLYMMASRRSGIILYSTSRIRTYDQIDVEQLHRLNLHASVTYFVDYSSKEVRDFLLQYRALFNTEPSRSAYSGYDLVKYFSTLAAKYGKKWPRALDKVEFTGLQSDFKLERTPGGGFVNNAVRRIVYNPDYSVTLVR